MNSDDYFDKLYVSQTWHFQQPAPPKKGSRNTTDKVSKTVCYTLSFVSRYRPAILSHHIAAETTRSIALRIDVYSNSMIKLWTINMPLSLPCSSEAFETYCISACKNRSKGNPHHVPGNLPIEVMDRITYMNDFHKKCQNLQIFS